MQITELIDGLHGLKAYDAYRKVIEEENCSFEIGTRPFEYHTVHNLLKMKNELEDSYGEVSLNDCDKWLEITKFLYQLYKDNE